MYLLFEPTNSDIGRNMKEFASWESLEFRFMMLNFTLSDDERTSMNRREL